MAVVEMLPWLVMMRGYPGVGKTTLAMKMQEMVGQECVVLDPDRLNLVGKDFLAFCSLLPEGTPSKVMPYRFLLSQAQRSLKIGHNVVWCQAWTKLWGIEHAVMSMQHEVDQLNVAVIEIVVPDYELRRRLDERRAKEGNILDKRPLEDFISSFERWPENFPIQVTHLEMDGMRSVGM